MVDNALVHYGVKGMHWGVRKDRKKNSSSRNKNLARRIDSESITRGKQFAKKAVFPVTTAVVTSALALSGMAYITPFLTLPVTLAGIDTSSHTKR